MADKQFEISAKPGDLIEIFRERYEHWAVYIGGNEVVHLVTPNTDDDLNSFGNLLTVLESSRAQVKRQKISEVVGFDRFRINNLLDDDYQPRERHIIVREACRMVGQVLPYSVATRNCEHFVTELRYGKAESRQVSTAVAVGLGGVAVAAVGVALLAALFKDDNKRRHRE